MFPDRLLGFSPPAWTRPKPDLQLTSTALPRIDSYHAASVTVKGVEEVGERYQDGLSYSTIRVAEMVTGKPFGAAAVLLTGPKSRCAACGKNQLAVAAVGGFGAATCGQYPYFLRARIQRGAFLATLAAS